ncbi:hypothetical protein HYR99_24435 [Candidatus Poribacteria bacterium]|nr:hypothetical protein [Candidatus Poribacteria bacterium]
MENRVVQEAVRKLADLIPNESGRVGAKSALAMGAVVSAAAIAQMLFTSSAQSDTACAWWSDCQASSPSTCCCDFSAPDQWGNPVHHRHCMKQSDCDLILNSHCHDGG